MSRISLATPCPAPTHSQLTLSTNLGQEDTVTGEVDYTKVIQHQFAHARPRRPRRKEKNAPVTVFEDVAEDQELLVSDGFRRGLLLGRPAQKPQGRSSIVPRELSLRGFEDGTDAQHSFKAIGQARRRVSVMPPASYRETVRLQAVVPQIAEDVANVKKEGLMKELRRRTIFVPSDDTTMLTIHPGANSRNGLEDTFQLPRVLIQARLRDEGTFLGGDMVQQKLASGRLSMSMAAAPKRIPLQQTAISCNVPSVDVPGQNGGKENMLPDPALQGKKDAKPARDLVKPAVVAPSKTSLSQSRLFEPTAASQARQSVVARTAVPLTRTMQQRLRNVEAKPVVKAASKAMAPAQAGLHPPRTSPEHQKPWKRSKAFMTSDQVAMVKLSQYPVLSEDLSQPELYENSWLSHQEAALTELLNQIFARNQPTPADYAVAQRPLRERLIDIYHRPAVTTLYKRLQASVLYGALSRPKDMPSPPNLTHDLGLRRHFLSLWLDSYEQDHLAAAVEVVLGRQMPRMSAASGQAEQSAEGLLDPHKGRRALTRFLETFLVSVEDARVEDETAGAVSLEQRRWEKTVLRSFMLVWVLDQAKMHAAVTGCLFKRTSSHKSSTAVLHSLSGLLLPSTGDITRVLRHLDYGVSHVQDPLDEVVYHIKNLAVDLRDGVYLARLVELLLYSSKAGSSDGLERQGDATVTITMPDATVLQSDRFDSHGGHCPQILSRHLKMPCLGRAQKVHNVDVALSAVGGSAKLLPYSDTTAADLVDGHREKTLALLWSLVSILGLEQLLDWRELTADVHRQRCLPAAGAVTAMPAPEDREALLQVWANSYSAPKGIRIANLTTSFADGKAYHAIVAAFAPFVPSTATKRTSGESSLETSLRSLGCSTAFIKQLCSNGCAIPSKSTTVANLAFLASRLLPLAGRHHAAVTLQRAYRLRRSWRALRQRLALMRLAADCAEIVQTRNRIVGSATVLQRAWRAVVATRLGKLNGDVRVFQRMARGWAARQRLRTVDRDYGIHTARVMGGW